MFIKKDVFTSFVTIQNCCCHPLGQYLLKHLGFCLHRGPTVFFWVLVFSVSINFLINSYLAHKSKNRKTSFNYALLFVLIQQNNVMFFSYSIRIMQCNDFEQKIICDENFRRNIETVFFYCRDLKISWLGHFPRFKKRGVWNKNVLGGKFYKN